MVSFRVEKSVYDSAVPALPKYRAVDTAGPVSYRKVSQATRHDVPALQARCGLPMLFLNGFSAFNEELGHRRSGRRDSGYGFVDTKSDDSPNLRLFSPQGCVLADFMRLSRRARPKGGQNRKSAERNARQRGETALFIRRWIADRHHSRR